MNRRAMFLEVLGIPAEWVPRRAPETTELAQAEVAEIAEEVAGAARPSAEPAQVAVSSAVAPGLADFAEVAEVTDIGKPAAAPDTLHAVNEAEVAETIEAFDAPGPAHAVEVPVPIALAPVQDGREALIATMDWPVLADSVAGCTACGLCSTRTNTVFGVGDQQAEWMLVGEAPGENEDLQGEPFVGQAGKLLDNMLGALGLARGRNVYIANVLKCRPPGNRNPEPGEVAQCEPYLKRQIALIKPKVIVVLGRFAAQSLLRSTTPIGKLRGAVHSYEGIPVVVTYHPAYLLRTLTDKARAWEDLCLAREVHDRAGPQA
ncbi:uracil-DNA glycosylase [Cupriavidus metallidurans]|uniref:Type-4 uracil-DNA glycosylase n=1 Tax=Cupriavidus metallidurans (strain ATCC 43123 / DSM 2839 / NBRC 102507 / CH34) TaxID=266264 RepID=Q1LNJ6_CUPMC|nr:uracil-DNA glycosylase [Cupriavidus metallidurans]ABF08280.1 DNA polymerase bacteriophage-type,uracil-DNA glycosylase superfamily [Cupriavidus metallidurans CH34]QGS30738.1 uracil-DNA glycosylase [Cupriavidus metallidurans]